MYIHFRKMSMYQGKNNKCKLYNKNSRATKKTFADKIGIKCKKKEFELDNAEELSLNTSIGYDHFQKVRISFRGLGYFQKVRISFRKLR